MEGFIRKHCSMTATLKKDCRAPLAMTNTTSPPEECKHLSSLRGTSATRQSHPPPSLRGTSATRQSHLPPSLRGTSATRQSHPPPVIARSVATWQSYPQKKGLLHPFGVRNDGSIQESRDINRSNRNSHSFLDIIESLKKMNLFLLSQR